MTEPAPPRSLQPGALTFTGTNLDSTEVTASDTYDTHGVAGAVESTLQVGSALQTALVLPVGLEQRVLSGGSVIWLNTVYRCLMSDHRGRVTYSLATG
jgi:hypothetical protein